MKIFKNVNFYLLFITAQDSIIMKIHANFQNMVATNIICILPYFLMKRFLSSIGVSSVMHNCCIHIKVSLNDTRLNIL